MGKEEQEEEEINHELKKLYFREEGVTEPSL
jgi:hypothetical protein